MNFRLGIAVLNDGLEEVRCDIVMKCALVWVGEIEAIDTTTKDTTAQVRVLVAQEAQALYVVVKGHELLGRRVPEPDSIIQTVGVLSQPRLAVSWELAAGMGPLPSR